MRCIVNPSRRLAKLQRRAGRRIARLRCLVDSLSLPPTAEKDRTVAWVVIEARNLWAGFLRAYYLSGARGTRTASGTPVSLVTLTFPDARAALIYSVRLLKSPGFSRSSVRRQDEPPWHVYSDYLRLCRTVGFSNLAQINSAFSYTTTFFELLTPVRNFYAHRCDETFRKAGQVGVKLGLSSKPDLRPTEIMCSKLPGRPQNIVTDWLDDIGNVIQLFCA